MVLQIDNAAADTFAIPNGRVEAFTNGERARSPCISAQPCNVFALTLSVPVTFSTLAFSAGESSFLGESLMVGGGVTFVLARGTYRVDNRETVPRYTVEDASPGFFFGVASQRGVRSWYDGQTVDAVTVSGFVGTGLFALSGGYDFNGRAPFAGLSINVTASSFLPRAAVIINAWGG